MKRALTLALFAGIVVALGLMGLQQAAAQSGITVTRGISPSSVPAEGGEVTVTINIDGAYSVGSVVEKLPDGFNYVGGSVIPTDIEPEVDGQDLRFPLLGELSFTYKVMTSASAGPHNFPSGSKLVYGLDRNEVFTVGDDLVTVAAAQSGITVTRGISPSSVPAEGGEVTVTINIDGAYSVGSVVEKLPAGFNYVGGSVIPTGIEPEVDGQDLRFSLLGELSFTYKVMTSASAGPHNFPSGSKLVYGLDRNEVFTVGDDLVTVAAAQSGITVTRGISPSSVPAEGGEVTVTINIDGAYSVGSVVEKLPDGFNYVGGSVIPTDIEPEVDGQDLRFPLLGELSFTYKVMTSASAGPHNFPSGSKLVYGLDRNEVFTVGDDLVTVAAAPSDDTCLGTLSVDEAVMGEWSSSCESTARAGWYARYYSFTLTEGSAVIITLESSTDPHLFLRAGAAKSGTVAHENDDIVVGTETNSRIQETLVAGTYTIEATTYGAGETGSFTLTVSDPGGDTGTMPGPSDDTCLGTLSVDEEVMGEWSSSCESTARAGWYARYYSFMLTEGSAVTITLESSTDTHLFLRAGAAKSGTVAHENDDIVVGTETNSRIQETLVAGTYTIEATTYGAGETGSFTLTVSDLGGDTGTMPGPSDDTCLGTLSVDEEVMGEWSSSCESTARAGWYARYYSFTLTEGSAVIITLESSTDPHLFLRAGAAKSGTVAHENDDIVVGTETNSRIQETLVAGTYTIEATTYGAGETGSFTLTVTMPGPSDDPCLDTLSADGAVSGEWSSSCESTARAGWYARYYSFTLTEGSAVTITLESSTDPHLFLRAGAAKSGTVAHENDDIVVGTNTNSRIQETLGVGTYTIEATTYGAGETGSFTLTVLSQ